MDRSSHDNSASFRTTSWSMVTAAAKQGDDRGDDGVTEDEVVQALERLCRTYWYPVYSFVRRTGVTREKAEDLAQGFFARLLEKNDLADADRRRGRFRSFLLASLKHYIANQRDRETAVKRGGRVRHLSLDFDQAEARYATEPVEGWTAEAIYDRNWALSLLRDVLGSLEQEYRDRGKGELFDALRPHLTGHATGETLAEVAAKLQTTTSAVKVAAHRLRSAYRTQLQQAVADTIDGTDEIDAERKLLLNAIAGS